VKLEKSTARIGEFETGEVLVGVSVAITFELVWFAVTGCGLREDPQNALVAIKTDMRKGVGFNVR
jgi:hypothetical protein